LKSTIGILDQTCAGWSGGASYTRAILTSLMAVKESGSARGAPLPEDDTIVFLARDGKIDIPNHFRRMSFASLADSSSRGTEDLRPDVVLPVRDGAVGQIRGTKVGWIPDFQHCRLPDLFSLGDLAARDALFETLARECELIIVSSENSLRDFETFLPASINRARVLPFPSTLWASSLDDRPQDVVSRYYLPSKFALVANQFWRHKNHSVLPLALSILKDRRVEVPLVLTGLPVDYRDAKNQPLSEFFQTCARLGIAGQIHFLGHLPYWDMISLMRCAAVIIQPSLFEGWNTSVEDAKALGRPLVCSDIPVHREQAPNALGFFEATSPEHLATVLGAHYQQLDAGPSLSVEIGALSQSKDQAVEFGRSLLSVAKEALHLANQRHRHPVIGALTASGTCIRRTTISRLREYLRQKRLHFQYLTGKFFYHFGYCNYQVEHLRVLLCRLSLRLHGQELGILRQHLAKPVRIERFPPLKTNGRRMPTIAIVTPSFNQGETLGVTIKSVLQQDYPQVEYAVVDGGSTDETTEVLAQFRSQLSYCVSEPDQGQAHAIEKGFKQLRGEIMGYLNSDDVLMPGALSFVAGYFAAHPDIDIIYGHRVIVDESGNEVGRWILPRHDEKVIRRFDYVPQETLFWRRSVYEAVGGVNTGLHFAIDWDLLLRFIAAGARFSRVPYFLACFRIHAKQKTHSLIDTVGEREKLRLLAREHPDGYNAEAAQKIQEWYRFRSNLCAILLKLGIRY
jgi:glycosyltransferase involved in cell wall biosynthesis